MIDTHLHILPCIDDGPETLEESLSLAHAERFRVFQKHPERLASLLPQGVLIQITASSLVGMQVRTVRRTAETLLRGRLVHCIASDAHDLHRRPPAIVQGCTVDWASKDAATHRGLSDGNYQRCAV